jgi:hypothetical protein
VKKIIFGLIFAVAVSGTVFAQETEKKETPVVEQEKFNTLFSDVKPGRLGGWGSPVLKLVNFAPGFNGPFGLMVGGEGGLIINRSFYIGGAGYSFVTDMDKYQITGAPTGYNVHLSYGGLIFKYHFFPTSVVNFSIGTVLGAGAYGSSVPKSTSMMNSSSPVFVAEPEIYMYINLAKFCRFGVGGSYRFLLDDTISKNGFQSTNGNLIAGNMWGYSINILFQFGRL